MSSSQKKTFLYIGLKSSESSFIYYKRKNNIRVNNKPLIFRKYDPIIRKHVVFKEIKLKKGKKN